MRYVIKPEDIPEEIGRTAWRIAVTSDKSGRRHLLAATLNAAIEAGLVSPPCYTIRNQQDGKLFHDVGQVRLRPGKPQIPAHEHWKGQTE